MGILNSELERFAKTKKFKTLVNEAVKNGTIGSSISAGGDITANVVEAAERLKDILNEEINRVQDEDPSLKNPLVQDDAIIIGKPELVKRPDGMYYQIIVSLSGDSVRKESISPNYDGLENVLLLYDAGYGHPIKGNLPYKVVDGKRITARRNIPYTGFINRAIERFNSEKSGVAVATRQ